jgi:hypothetical protein
MAKKTPGTPRPDHSTARTDVVTRVSTAAVSRHAYGLFQARGSEHGHDVEDWLEAEAELLNNSTSEIASGLAETPRRVG